MIGMVFDSAGNAVGTFDVCETCGHETGRGNIIFDWANGMKTMVVCDHCRSPLEVAA